MNNPPKSRIVDLRQVPANGAIVKLAERVANAESKLSAIESLLRARSVDDMVPCRELWRILGYGDGIPPECRHGANPAACVACDIEAGAVKEANR